MSKNEVTVTINVSDSLLETFAKILLVANSPIPPMMALPQMVMGQPEPSRPIGFQGKNK